MHPVVALDPATARDRVQPPAAGGAEVRFVESFGEVKRYLAGRREATNVIVDPELLSAENAGELAWPCGRRPFRVLALASVGAAGVTAVIRLPLRCDCDVLFVKADDVSLLMQHWLGRERATSRCPRACCAAPAWRGRPTCSAAGQSLRRCPMSRAPSGC